MPEMLASGVLYTTTLDSSSEGYWSNSTARLSPELACWRPLRSVVEKSGARPRIEITCARPLTRCAVNPGRTRNRFCDRHIRQFANVFCGYRFNDRQFFAFGVD
jgi:hypothetical protein